MKIIIILLALISLTRSQKSNSCPSAEDIKPCSCKLGLYDKPFITCKNLKSSEELLKSVKNMENYVLGSFTLEDSNIQVLPSDAFVSVEIEHLIINRVNLTKLSDNRSRPPFVGLEKSLLYLEIKKSFQNKNQPLASLQLSHLKKLSSVQLEGNLIPTIGNNWFENGPYNLKELRISNANISVLGSHVFEALERLEYFVLAGCSVSEITRDMFPAPAEFLTSLDFSNNKLSSFPSNFFTKMPSLSHIILVNNLFTTIDEVIWAPIWSRLEYIYFHGNPIVCDKDLKWIYNYRLPEYYSGYCASPKKLLHKDLRNITIVDLQ